MAEAPNSLEHQAVMPNTSEQQRVHHTHGQTLFNWGVYGGINGVGNFILTIPLAYWCLHGEGAKYFERGGKAMEKVGLKANHAKEVLEMLGTSFGGWAMLAPVYVAEHYRKPAVEWLNQKFGSEQDKQTVVHHPPKQTVGSLLVGRATAMATVMAAFRTAGAFFPQQFDGFQEKVATKLCKIFDKPVRDALGNETKAYHYGRMAALDVFATASATVLLYSISRAAAKNRDVRRERREERRADHVSPEDVFAQSGDIAISSRENTGLSNTPDTRIVGDKEHMEHIVQTPVVTVEAVR